MKKKLLTGLVISLFVIGFGLNANALIINGGFEDGFNGWTPDVTSGGSANVVTQYIDSMNYYPVEGAYFALLGGSATLSQSILMDTGDVLSGWSAFDANDWCNDYAYVKIYNSGGGLVTPWYDNVAEVGSLGNSDWTSWSWTATASDTYKLTFGVNNYGNTWYDSYALFDANVHQSSTAPVPEPATILLVGTGLLGIIAFGRKRFNKRA